MAIPCPTCGRPTATLPADWFIRAVRGLLAEPFTLTEAHQLYEELCGEDRDLSNFRRDILATGMLEETGETYTEGVGRPGKLYRRQEAMA